MPRLLHMADVHLGARHDDMGPVAAEQRERQFSAFKRAIGLAISEKVDAVLICGDLFDSNGQPRRSVERAATELGKAVARQIPVVIIPGTHDSYDAGSIYRIFDLAEMSGASPDSDLLTVLTDSRPLVEFEHIGLSVVARVFPTKRAPHSPLVGLADGASAKWKVGMVHGSFAVPGRFDQDEVSFTDAEVGASGLDYLALGHWHSFREGRSNGVAWAYSGAPDLVALDQDGAGQVLLVSLDERDGQRQVTVEPRQVGRSHFRKMEVDASTLASQAELEGSLREQADPDRVLDVRVVGIRPSELDLNVDELERQLSGSFLRIRLRDVSVAPLPEDLNAPADTIVGALARDLHGRIAEHEERGEAERAAELREALRIAVLLLDDAQRVTLA